MGKAMIINIKIRAEQGVGITIGCSQNGKRLDMTVPSNINLVAGMLAEVSCKMVGHNNKQLIKKEK